MKTEHRLDKGEDHGNLDLDQRHEQIVRKFRNKNPGLVERIITFIKQYLWPI